MKRSLVLLGAVALVGLLVCLSGCVLHTRTLTIVVTDFVCTGFYENHDNENYTDDVVTVDETFFQDLDNILADNDLTKDDVESVEVVGAYYQVTDGPDYGPWTVSGKVWIIVDEGPRIPIISYQSIHVTGPMAAPVRVNTVQAGLDALNGALEEYLAEPSPLDYPMIEFVADRETGDIDPTPTIDEPLIMTWDGCLSMRVDFTEEYDVYDLFPGE
jgi:hypothetical protein